MPSWRSFWRFSRGTSPTGTAEMIQDVATTLRTRHCRAAVLFAAGIATSLTPCIYPMIPITAGVLGGAGAAARSRRRTVRVTLLLRAGPGAGLRVARPGRRTHRHAVRHHLVQSLGLSRLRQPAAARRARDVRRHSGAAPRPASWPGPDASAPIRSAVRSSWAPPPGLVAAPCGAPAFAAVLAWVAETQSAVWGFISLCSYSHSG